MTLGLDYLRPAAPAAAGPAARPSRVTGLLRRQWPDFLVAGALLYLAALLTLQDYSRTPAAFALWVVFGLNWFLLGHRAIRGLDRLPTPAIPWDAAFLAGLVVLGALAGYVINSSFFAGLALPMLWLASRRVRRAVSLAIVYTAASLAGALTWFAANVTWPWTWSAPLPDGRPGPWSQVTAALSAGILVIVITLILAHRQARQLDTQRRLVAAHREAGVQAERARLARDLHDTVTQDLTGLVMLAARAQRQLRQADTPARSQQCADSLALIEQVARSSLEESRGLVATIMPVAVTSTLAEALRRLAQRVERETGTEITLTLDETIDFSRENQVFLLRCVQEGLANVRKHARAAHVHIDLVRLGADEACLTVADDGVGVPAGFTPGAETDAEQGFGLLGLRDRLLLIGGALALEPRPEGGSQLTIRLPLDANPPLDWTRLLAVVTGGRATP